MLGNHQSLSGNQIAILGCPLGNHLPIKFGKPCTYIANLQKEENKALRYIVNARRKTAISALRGEFGISLIQHNSLLREIFLHEFEEKKPSKWIKQVKKYMLDLQFTLHTIEYSKPQYIRKMIKEFDDKLWLEDLQ